MIFLRAATLVLMIGMLTGCPGRRTAQAPAPAPDPQQALQDTRREFQRLNPQVQVGLVTIVREDAHLAAVSELPLEDLQAGQIVNFIDVNRRPLVSGTIVRITDVSAHVRYDAPPQDRRHPREGDLAVLIPGGQRRQ
jgi:hypothetical protein